MEHFQQHSYSLGQIQIFPFFFHTWRQQGCFCTKLFTRLLQGCLQGCYKVVTRLLQGCQLHTCNQVVTRLVHNLVATLLQGCYNLVFSVWVVSIVKTKFMVVGYDVEECDVQPISVDCGEIEHVTEFQYLVSIIAENGKIDAEIDTTHS